MLCDNCNTVNSSYSNFGHTYEMNGKPKESLCGAYNFTVKDYEVFQVTYSGKYEAGSGKKKWEYLKFMKYLVMIFMIKLMVLWCIFWI